MPWTETARREYGRRSPRYASDLTDGDSQGNRFRLTGLWVCRGIPKGLKCDSHVRFQCSGHGFSLAVASIQVCGCAGLDAAARGDG